MNIVCRFIMIVCIGGTILLSTTDAVAKSTAVIDISAQQVKQKLKQILYLAMPMLLVKGIYPNMTHDLLEKILGKPTRYNSCYVSSENFQRIRLVINTFLYFSLASYFWPKALNTSANINK